MTEDRNYPQERKALDPVDDAMLNVWLNAGGAMGRAAKEIMFSRFWLKKMEQDIWRGDQLVAKALKNHQTTLGLIGEIHKAFEGAREKDRPLDPDYWIFKIERVMKPVIKPDEG